MTQERPGGVAPRPQEVAVATVAPCGSRYAGTGGLNMARWRGGARSRPTRQTVDCAPLAIHESVPGHLLRPRLFDACPAWFIR